MYAFIILYLYTEEKYLCGCIVNTTFARQYAGDNNFSHLEYKKNWTFLNSKVHEQEHFILSH